MRKMPEEYGTRLISYPRGAGSQNQGLRTVPRYELTLDGRARVSDRVRKRAARKRAARSERSCCLLCSAEWINRGVGTSSESSDSLAIGATA